MSVCFTFSVINEAPLSWSTIANPIYTNSVRWHGDSRRPGDADEPGRIKTRMIIYGAVLFELFLGTVKTINNKEPLNGRMISQWARRRDVYKHHSINSPFCVTLRWGVGWDIVSLCGQLWTDRILMSFQKASFCGALHAIFITIKYLFISWRNLQTNPSQIHICKRRRRTL